MSGAETKPPPRRGLRMAGAAAALLILAVLVWGGWRWATTPRLPDFSLGDAADPALRRAVDEARAAVQADPRAAAGWGRLGQLLVAHAYPVEARPCLEQAEALDGTDPRWPYLLGWALLMDYPEKAPPCFERALERCPPDSPVQHAVRLRLAQTLFDRGEFAAADAHFQALLEVQPGNPLVQLGLGSTALTRGEVAVAVEALKCCDDSPYTRQRACAHLATAYRREGKADLADAFERRALDLPKDAEWPDPFLRETEALIVGHQARFLRAENLYRAGELKAAAEQFRKLADEYPDDSRIPVKLGLILVEIGAYAEAEAILRPVVAREPTKVQGQFLLSAALFHQAERLAAPKAAAGFEEAAAHARLALARQPNHAFAHVYLGLALRKLGRLPEAIDELAAAARCSPESADPHLHYGEALLAAGRTDDGVRELEAAVRVASPTDSRPRNALARARGKGEKRSEAMK